MNQQSTLLNSTMSDLLITIQKTGQKAPNSDEKSIQQIQEYSYCLIHDTSTTQTFIKIQHSYVSSGNALKKYLKHNALSHHIHHRTNKKHYPLR